LKPDPGWKEPTFNTLFLVSRAPERVWHTDYPSRGLSPPCCTITFLRPVDAVHLALAGASGERGLYPTTPHTPAFRSGGPLPGRGYYTFRLCAFWAFAELAPSHALRAEFVYPKKRREFEEGRRSFLSQHATQPIRTLQLPPPASPSPGLPHRRSSGFVPGNPPVRNLGLKRDICRARQPAPQRRP
jgi:hypothetical protein